MILQSLYEYYRRKADDPDSNIAPEGFEWKEIPFIIVIDREGKFVRIEDTREGDEKIKRGKRFLVPQGEKKAAGIKANLLWDSVEYTVGANPRNRSDIKKRREAFLAKIQETFTETIQDSTIKMVLMFLENDPLGQIDQDPNTSALWKEACELNANITFRIEGTEHPTICDAVFESLRSRTTSGESRELCLVTGERHPIARLAPSIKGVRDAQSSGAALVSFNLPAFTSFNKTQNFNAPISETATFAYTTALNLLLSKDSTNRLQVGDATTVFWANRQTDFENAFPSFFRFPPKDNPDADIRAVRELYDGIWTGNTPGVSETRFFVLGLSPNAARISVRFWLQGYLKDFEKKIRMHFDDLEIVRPGFDSGRCALMSLLCAVSQEGKAEKIPPNLAGDVMRAILQGTPYPATLLHQCIRRIRAEQFAKRSGGDPAAGRMRASILKAYLNRFRRTHPDTEKEITVALDIENTNVGYRLGRLFACLEKIQEDANPGINATIRDRFYGAASANPVTVFPQLLKLKNHHLAKLENQAYKRTHEIRLTEIIGGLTTEMPSHLSIDEQARFAIGYYHQMQDIYKSKQDKTE